LFGVGIGTALVEVPTESIAEKNKAPPGGGTQLDFPGPAKPNFSATRHGQFCGFNVWNR
jgi:hypothetical protein